MTSVNLLVCRAEFRIYNSAKAPGVKPVLSFIKQFKYTGDSILLVCAGPTALQSAAIWGDKNFTLECNKISYKTSMAVTKSHETNRA